VKRKEPRGRVSKTVAHQFSCDYPRVGEAVWLLIWLGHVPIWTYHLTSSGKNKPYALYLCKKLARVLTTDIFANYTFTDHDVKKPLKTRQFPARNLIALSICSATALAWTDHVQFQLETRLLLDQLTCQRV